MADETKTRYFYGLLKLHTKRVCYEHHMEFLENCKAKDVIPHGFMLHKTANLDNCSDEFQNNWMNILNRASGELRDLVFTECRLTNESTRQNILDMENCLVREYGEYGEQVRVLFEKQPFCF